MSRFVVAWELSRGGVAVTCAEAGVERVIVRSALGAEVLVDELACDAGAGQTRALPAGRYIVSAVAVAADDAELGSSAPQTAELAEAGDVQTLEPFAIDVP